MENNPNPVEAKPFFENDRLTDLVLHKDDVPDVKNGEIVNEPDDVDEKAVQDDSFLTVNGSSENCWFPIHFTYADKEYSADVHTAKADVKEYHVCEVTPAIVNLPDPFIVAAHISGEKFDFPVNEIYYPPAFGAAVVKAISNGYSGDINDDELD